MRLYRMGDLFIWQVSASSFWNWVKCPFFPTPCTNWSIHVQQSGRVRSSHPADPIVSNLGTCSNILLQFCVNRELYSRYFDWSLQTAPTLNAVLYDLTIFSYFVRTWRGYERFYPTWNCNRILLVIVFLYHRGHKNIQMSLVLILNR